MARQAPTILVRLSRRSGEKRRDACQPPGQFARYSPVTAWTPKAGKLKREGGACVSGRFGGVETGDLAGGVLALVFGQAVFVAPAGHGSDD